jgi:hypothetical protein
MDFSKLAQNERMAAIAAAVLVVAGIVAAATYSIYSMTWLAVLASLGLLFVVFQPQIAAGTSLPGSRGSLMLLLGGIAGAVMVLALLVTIGLVFVAFGIADIMFLVAVAAGVVAAWASWQAFQAEGGKFQLGSTAAAAPSGTPPASPDARSETASVADARTAAPDEPPADVRSTPPPEAASADEEPGEERRTEI